MAKNITTYVTTTVGIETGSQELQQKTDLVLSVASDAANTANTILAGSAAIGGVFGVAAGATVAAVNLAIKYSTKYAQMQQQMRLEEEQLALYRSRMGAGFNQSRNGGAR